MDSQIWIAWFLDYVRVMIILGIIKRFSPLDSVLIWMLPKKFRESELQFGKYHVAKIAKRLEWHLPRLDL
jgi:hypothetical protein